ncbi:MAG: hypothetical protein KJO00_10260 [Bacteroidia bacterium]|nr:hypothetical protein [Bacteroidia bacterium]
MIKINITKITLAQIITVLIFLLSFENYAQNQSIDSSANIVTSEDLEIILGEWTGSLTYIDYGSNKPYTMPANLSVKKGKNKNQLLLYNIYPNEPKANSKDKITLSKKGDRLNNKMIISREKLSNGQVQITTEYFGKDNNKKATIRNIYLLGKNQFIIKKEVRFENSDEWLKRNEYNFKR